MKKNKEHRREFPDWDQKYQAEELKSMPWYYPELDPDLEEALSQLNIVSGDVWDLGSGPGTQAMALAQKGFAVTATDVSAFAIKKASSLAIKRKLSIDFEQGDVLKCTLKKKFDLIFDRGCFHIFYAKQRDDYAKTVSRLLKPGGYLFLKCFSHLETIEEGPYRFSPEQIKAIFEPYLTVCSIKATVYQGNMEVLPKALFCVLQKI